ncbi:2,3-diaminopropionate biosynthesis protein SbnB [Xenorhabdus bovienii]|uniref:2,3-diaminopropionate biosynthesis protein SbnB n=1 Tax=Xenorhabdus bovienii TaxID=40576 RepID=UPI0023B30625|nr:2,3-diaminopropionate biosynthesis protein SbnB [Xenorhabdus bovienii]MDE9453245.1 2,3-diaminopropionate biosynthesis protein SbnB [Xenorhabdus bovienii]
MQPSFNIVCGYFIKSLLEKSHYDVADLVVKTYIDHEEKKTINPDSYFLRFPEKDNARIIALPAAISGGDKISGIKWIASYPDNLEYNLQRASAVLILNDYNTGYPFACLESSQISSHRTAASAVKAAELLANCEKQSNKISIIGAGVIARTISSYLKGLDWNIDTIDIYDQNYESASHLKNFIRNELNFDVTAKTSLKESVKNASHIFLTTTASTPYILDENFFSAGQVIINISLRDIGPRIILNSYNIVDDIEHCLKANTSPHLAEKEVKNRNFINGTIAQVFNKNLFLKHDKPIIFSPFGLGVLDLSLGYYIYKKAIESNEATEIPFFFPSVNRW